MARETSGCAFFTMLAFFGLAGLFIVGAADSTAVAAGVTLFWLLLLVYGLRRTFGRRRLGGTLMVASTLWLSISGILWLGVGLQHREVAERRQSLVADKEFNYGRGADLLEQGETAEALRFLEMVEEVDPEYKDLWELLQMAREAEEARRVAALVAEAERLDPSEIERLSEVYGELSELRPGDPTYELRAETYRQRVAEKQEQTRQAEAAVREERARREAAEREERRDERQQRRLADARERQLEENAEAAAQLELGSWKWEVAHGYVEAEGWVTNKTEWPLKDVQARIRYLDRRGETVKTDACMLGVNPLSPGSSSGFRCVIEHDPAIDSATLSFALVTGTPIRHYQR
jgi:hypothetical protein